MQLVETRVSCRKSRRWIFYGFIFKGIQIVGRLEEQYEQYWHCNCQKLNLNKMSLKLFWKKKKKLKASWSFAKFSQLVWTLHSLIKKKPKPTNHLLIILRTAISLSAVRLPKNKTKGPLTKETVMLKLSLKTGLWKVVIYLMVASTCKIVFRCDIYFCWVVHLIIKILRPTLLLKFRNNGFLWEVCTTALVTHSMPPFEFGFWCCYIYFHSLMPSAIQVLSE